MYNIVSTIYVLVLCLKSRQLRRIACFSFKAKDAPAHLLETPQAKLRYPAFEPPKYSSKLQKVSPHRGDLKLSFKPKTQKAKLNKKEDFASFRFKTLIFNINCKAKLLLVNHRA